MGLAASFEVKVIVAVPPSVGQDVRPSVGIEVAERHHTVALGNERMGFRVIF